MNYRLRLALTTGLLSVLAVATVGTARFAQAPTGAHSMPTSVISPVVVASWFTERAANGREQLQLLVLWRGTPGWFMGGGQDKSSTLYPANVSTRRMTYGRVTLTLDYDWRKRVAVVNGETITLGDHNVLFVDDVDAAPRIVDRLRIDPAMPGSSAQIGVVLQRVPQVMSFLKCDAVGADESKRAYFGRMCLEKIGVER